MSKRVNKIVLFFTSSHNVWGSDRDEVWKQNTFIVIQTRNSTGFFALIISLWHLQNKSEIYFIVYFLLVFALKEETLRGWRTYISPSLLFAWCDPILLEKHQHHHPSNQLTDWTSETEPTKHIAINVVGQ